MFTWIDTTWMTSSQKIFILFLYQSLKWGTYIKLANSKTYVHNTTFHWYHNTECTSITTRYDQMVRLCVKGSVFIHSHLCLEYLFLEILAIFFNIIDICRASCMPKIWEHCLASICTWPCCHRNRWKCYDQNTTNFNESYRYILTLWSNKVNITDADALALCIIRTSEPMILTLLNR